MYRDEILYKFGVLYRKILSLRLDILCFVSFFCSYDTHAALCGRVSYILLVFGAFKCTANSPTVCELRGTGSL